MSESTAKLGRIVGFSGSWGSGIATLTVKDIPSNEVVSLHADSGPLGRALSSCFGAGQAGNCIDNDAIAGQLIYYAVDDLGLLEGFAPAEDLIEGDLVD